MPRRLRHEDYTVGWICALPVELAAAQEMLDEEHEDLERDDDDENLYSLGSVAGHNVVIVCLPAGRIGNNPAAAVATQMRAAFKGIRFGLMVGIGGGVPSPEGDIRLGDVVVSQPHQTFSGVVQYDVGKTTLSGFERTGSLNSPPQILLSAVSKVQASKRRGKSKLSEYVSKLDCIPEFQRDKAGPDILFKAAYDHKGGQACELCNTDKQEARHPREREEAGIHYGTIASGNQVIRDGRTRDRLSSELGGVLCFEMEAAGLMNSFPCLVIRGICDYADSHKNKKWQPYAAGTAAAYAKELLSVIPPTAKVRIAGKSHQEEKEDKKCIQLLQRELPPQILWQKHVVLNDARGRILPFHLELIDSAELFVEVLKSKFKDLGLEKVKRGEWLLQDHHSERILDLRKPWGALIRPGQTLDMSMIFRKRGVSSTHCPTCLSKNDGPPETQSTCSTCGLVYRRIEEIQGIGVQEDDFHTSSRSAAHQIPKHGQRLPALSPRPRPPKPQDDEDDISDYIRVQVIDTRFRVQKAEESNMVAVLATLRLEDFENTELLSAYLASICGISEEDCLAALEECNTEVLAVRAKFEQTQAFHLELEPAAPDYFKKVDNTNERERRHREQLQRQQEEARRYPEAERLAKLEVEHREAEKKREREKRIARKAEAQLGPKPDPFELAFGNSSLETHSGGLSYSNPHTLSEHHPPNQHNHGSIESSRLETEESGSDEESGTSTDTEKKESSSLLSEISSRAIDILWTPSTGRTPGRSVSGKRIHRRHNRSQPRGYSTLDEIYVHPLFFRNSIIESSRLEQQDSGTNTEKDISWTPSTGQTHGYASAGGYASDSDYAEGLGIDGPDQIDSNSSTPPGAVTPRPDPTDQRLPGILRRYFGQNTPPQTPRTRSLGVD